MHQLEYVVPRAEHEAAALALRSAFFKNGEPVIHGSCRWDSVYAYEDWLRHYDRSQQGTEPGRPQSSTYFVRYAGNDELIGMVDIRHRLNKVQYQYGHVGYSVAPRERGKGVGEAMLRWALGRARGLCKEDVVLCCYSDNAASRRVMQKCGLAQFDGFKEEATGLFVCMYK